MRTTASYDLFPDARSERALARARWLAREGRTQDAETAYDELLAAKPDLKAGWAEYFELLRSTGRAAEALQLADRARATFGETGVPQHASECAKDASSTVITSIPSALYAGDARIFGTSAARNRSADTSPPGWPSTHGVSCPSWQRLGVM